MGIDELPSVYRGFESESMLHYDADEGRGWILFALPATGDASDAALVCPVG
ncbi:hypothetical protein [Haladaptatus halobius]|uniref:hypothetical protein n=1 Tax=Haladaptatus halobius TaxID=2884875 RepID=UPI001D0AA665|nr:hypothetical protein [Haladaptatus halobius]